MEFMQGFINVWVSFIAEITSYDIDWYFIGDFIGKFFLISIVIVIVSVLFLLFVCYDSYDDYGCSTKSMFDLKHQLPSLKIRIWR